MAVQVELKIQVGKRVLKHPLGAGARAKARLLRLRKVKQVRRATRVKRAMRVRRARATRVMKCQT